MKRTLDTAQGGRFAWYRRWPLWAKIAAPLFALFTFFVVIGAVTGPVKQQNTVAVAPTITAATAPVTTTAPATTTTTSVAATTTTTVAPTTTSVAPTTTTTTTNTAVTPDELFLSAVGYNSGKFGTALPAVSDSNLIGLGRAACSDFDNGGSVQQVEIDALIAEGSTGLSAGQMGTIIGSAVEVYCPKYNPQLLAIGPPTS